ncbi:hypothetical protein [Rhodococcus tukisamuensis]|uniref:Uncharacterized protein n=1 Tax=Rhodococcus tukisamuensis TaxID=168276 RepID=A0A1G6QM38_9NOCA|nr:hypothetical protein [Rhodococcus tukisamuensis]SDC93462.1 hypothetical protein SAMN05444580_102127 [Rhodococcus tukisamuensis]
MSPSHDCTLDWNITPDPPGADEAVQLLGQYRQAIVERRYVPDLAPLTAQDHTIALHVVSELARRVDDYRHSIIEQALAAHLSWEAIAGSLRLDVGTIQEIYRSRLDRQFPPTDLG